MPLVRDVGRRSTQLLDLQCDLSLGGDERALLTGLELEGFFLKGPCGFYHLSLTHLLAISFIFILGNSTRLFTSLKSKRSHPESKPMISEQSTWPFPVGKEVRKKDG